MTNRTLTLDQRLHDYLFDIGVTEHPVQRELREYTASHRLAKMQISPDQGQLLGWLVRLTGARRTLEVGVFTGYSALSVALALPDDGEVVACDVSDTFTRIAREYWQRAGVAGRIRLELRPALDTLHQLIADGEAGRFDLAFIDADKPTTPEYLDACHCLVRPGGIIAIDNIFLGGRVVAPQESDPPGVHVMHAFNAALRDDERFHPCVLPMGDGLTLLIRR